MLRSRLGALVPVLALLSAACGGGGDEIKIGLAGPFSAANGESMQRAAQMAAAEIGEIGGRKIVLEFVDDHANPNEALTVAEKLRGDPDVVAVIGHVNSATSLKAATVYNDEERAGSPVVQISPASSAPALSDAGPWTFRITPTDLEFSPVLARYARQLGKSRAAVLYANDDYGQGVATTFADAFRRDGGTVVSSDPYLPGVIKTGGELDAYLSRAFRRGADALVIGGQADAGVRIVQAARRLGYAGPILGADGMTGVKDAGATGEGVYVSSAFLPDNPSQQARTFVEAYVRRYDALPDHRGAMTYDIMYMLRAAIEEVGTDREAIRDYVASIGNGRPAYAGVSGPISFNEDGDVKGKPVTVGVVRNGRLVTAPNQ